ncbi:unnamed protein product, partial [Polarella glacialis]
PRAGYLSRIALWSSRWLSTWLASDCPFVPDKLGARVVVQEHARVRDLVVAVVLVLALVLVLVLVVVFVVTTKAGHMQLELAHVLFQHMSV